jgi:hypothetical protein
MSQDSARTATATILLQEAARARGALLPADSLRREGLLALTRGQWVGACAAFDRLLELEPEAFDAWFGRGDCLLRDQRVVPHPRSPTGYVFLVGRESAVRAFERAAEMSAWRGPPLLFSEFARALPLQSNMGRPGVLMGTDRTFIGRLALIDDTLTHLAMPIEQTELDADASTAFRAMSARAHEVARRRAADAATRWLQTVPSRPEPLLWLADALEAGGSLTAARDDGWSAVGALRSASRMAALPVSRASLLAHESHLLFKAGRLAESRAVAAEALRAHAQPTVEEAAALVGLAAFLGDRERLETLVTQLAASSSGRLRGADNLELDLPPVLLAERARFHAAVLVGACDDDVRFGMERLERVIRGTEADGRRRAELLETLAARTRRLAIPCLGPAPDTARYVMQETNWPLLDAGARRDTTRVGALLSELAAILGDTPEAAYTADVIFAAAWSAVQIGDSLGAHQRLSRYFAGMPALPRGLLRWPEEAAAVRRSLLLARELAGRLQGLDRGGWWLADVPGIPPVATPTGATQSPSP